MRASRGSRVNYAALNEEGEDAPADDRFASLVRERLPTLAPASGRVDELATGASLTLAWLRARGLARPVVVHDVSGSGLVLPPPSFTVRDVAAALGPAFPIDVIDVALQGEVAGSWTVGEWADFFHDTERRRILNVISVEFSGTPLATAVTPPRIVRQIDWIDIAWPGARRACGEFPQVQLYCLMSCALSYTDFHVDFGGTSVWYSVHTGSKVFFLVPPSEDALRAYEAWTSNKDQSTTFFIDTLPPSVRSEAFALTLRAGEMMLIPSGWIHAVYTPEDSLVFGGNFLTGLAMGAQLRVYELEQSLAIPRKYRFPFFEQTLWFAAALYVQYTRLPEFKAALAAARAIVMAGVAVGGEGSDEDDAETTLAYRTAALSASLSRMSLARAELAGLPILLRTLTHLRTAYWMRQQSLDGGGADAAGAPVAGAASPEALKAGAASASAIPISEPPARQTLRFGSRPKLLPSAAAVGAALLHDASAVAGAGAGAGAVSASFLTASSSRRRASRIKGALRGPRGSGGGSGSGALSPLSGTFGEDEYETFPPSEAAMEAAAMAGVEGGPEGLLRELAAALGDGVTPVLHQELQRLPRGSDVDTAPLKSLLAAHGGDPHLGRTVPGPLYVSNGWTKGALVLHLPTTTTTTEALASRGGAVATASAAAAADAVGAPSLPPTLLPRCKLGLYGGATPLLPDASAKPRLVLRMGAGAGASAAAALSASNAPHKTLGHKRGHKQIGSSGGGGGASSSKRKKKDHTQQQKKKHRLNDTGGDDAGAADGDFEGEEDSSDDDISDDEEVDDDEDEEGGGSGTGESGTGDSGEEEEEEDEEEEESGRAAGYAIGPETDLSDPPKRKAESGGAPAAARSSKYTDDEEEEDEGDDEEEGDGEEDDDEDGGGGRQRGADLRGGEIDRRDQRQVARELAESLLGAGASKAPPSVPARGGRGGRGGGAGGGGAPRASAAAPAGSCLFSSAPPKKAAAGGAGGGMSALRAALAKRGHGRGR